MTNPDRAELRLQPTSTPENPRQNRHIPRWLRMPTLVARTTLAFLVASPGTVVAVDAITRSANPSSVYASGIVSGKLVGIERLEDCKWDIKMEATGFRPGIPIVVLTFSDNNAYNCPGGDRSINYQAARIDSWEGVGVADSNGHIFFDIIQDRYGSFRYQVFSDTITAAYHDSFWINVSYSRDQIPINTPRPTIISIPTATPTFTNEQIEIKKRAGLLPTNTPLSTPTPRLTVNPEVRPTQAVPIVPTPTPGIPDWLWGLGAASLAGLAAYWGYGRGKQKNPSPPPPGSGGPNPNTGPATAPSTGPAQPKNPEWVIGQKDFERRWQEVKSKLPPLRPGDTGNEQGYILDRFKAGMSIVHEVSLEDATGVPEMDTRIRAGIEYLTAEIWPDNRIFKRFFDPSFNAGLLTPEDLARIIYLPESYRHLSIFTKAQKRDINRIHRTLLHALHPDLLKKDSDPKLKDSMDLLLRQLNSAWPLINKLIG